MGIPHGPSIWRLHTAKTGYFTRNADIFCNIGANIPYHKHTHLDCTLIVHIILISKELLATKS